MDHSIKIFDTVTDKVQFDLIQQEHNERQRIISSIFAEGITINGYKYHYPEPFIIPPGSFLFRPSSEYINLMEKLSVPKEIDFFYDSVLDHLIRDSLGHSLHEFSRPVVNKWNLLDPGFKFQRATIDELKRELTERKIACRYVIEQVVYLNEFAKNDYKEVYTPVISVIGKKLLNENKKSG